MRVRAIAVAMLFGAARADAQTVTRIIVRDSAGSEAIAGAVVSLVSPSGRIIRALRTDEHGKVIMPRDTASGRIVVQRLGFAPWHSNESHIPGDTLVIRLARHRMLATMVVHEARQCSAEASGEAVAQAWEDARTALVSSIVSASEPRQLVRVRRFERTLDPALRLRGEQSRDTLLSELVPFTSIAPESLSHAGYIVGDIRGGFEYYAPDAHVLLSEQFAATHCFALVDSLVRPGNATLVRLRFAPSPSRTRPDVQGTFEIDRHTHVLQSVDFAYVNLPFDTGAPEAGGRVVFEEVAPGIIRIREWRVRTPRLASQPGPVVPGLTRREQLSVIAYREVGGRVVASP